MTITGTLVNYFVHCKRQCYLHYHKINLEDESELVKIGKAIHEDKNTSELTIENIKIDKIKKDYLLEIKKSDADLDAAKMQVLYYLFKLKEKGIDKKGMIEVVEKKKEFKKLHEVLLTEENEIMLKNLIKDLEILLSQEEIPKIEKDKKCKKCAYYPYCYI